MFKKTYIYIKTCNHCGLKYFGKTIKNDVKSYRGSGLYWSRHIKKFGYNCNTFIIKTFSDKNKCKDFCIWFSKINNIKKSNKWANLMYENGLDGGSEPGKKLSEEHKNKIRNSQIGKKLSKEHIENLRKSLLGRKHSKETIEKMRKAKIGKKFTEIHKKNLRKPKSEEHKEKLRQLHLGKTLSKEHIEKLRQIHLGKSLSNEHKEKLRKAHLGKKQPIVKCPHCDKKGGKSNMKRWHFNNCKLKIDKNKIKK